MSSHALFFAVKPDAPATEQLLALGRRLREHHGLTGRLFEAARLHVTLHFFGRYPSLDGTLVEGLCRAAQDVSGSPFKLRFDHVSSFGRSRNAPLVMKASDDAPGIRRLYQHLAEALARHGFDTRLERRFLPHLTLLYDDKSLPEHEVAPIEWTVDRFELVHSEAGRGHRVLRHWPLDASGSRVDRHNLDSFI
jgi:2'-5' RNA ligase